MKITKDHHKRLPYLHRLTDDLTKEQRTMLEALLDDVYAEGHKAGYATGHSAGYQIGNPNYDED